MDIDRRIENYLDSHEFQMLKSALNIDMTDHEQKVREILRDILMENGEIEGNVVIKELMRQFDKDPEDFMGTMMDQMGEMGEEDDRLTNLITKEQFSEDNCRVCGKAKSELCEHITGTERLELLRQHGKTEEAYEILETLDLDKIDELIWEISIRLVKEPINKIKPSLDELSQMVHEADDIKDIFRTQVLKITYLMEKEDFEQSMQMAKQLQPFAQKLDKTEDKNIIIWMCRLSTVMTRSLMKLGHIQPALESGYVALEHAIRANSNYYISLSLAILSTVFAMKQDHENANKASDDALSLMKGLDNEFGLLQIYPMIGMAQMLQNNLEYAMELGDNAVEIAKRIKDPDKLATAYLLKTSVYLYQKEHDKALDYLKESLDSVENDEFRQVIISLKGDIYADMGQIDRAKEIYKKIMDKWEGGDSFLLSLSARLEELDKLK